MSYSMWAGKRRAMARRGWGPRGGHFMGPGPFFSGRPKVGRGGVRIAILYLLAEEPMHGYQIMSKLTERTDGVWQPSPGSIYPTLSQLEDEGLVRAEEREGKKVYTLTDEGKAFVDSSKTTPPWEHFGPGVDDELLGLRDVGFQVGAAVMQVARAGSEAQVANVKEVLEETRRRIYEILAEQAPQD
jgi:DNA-binding PadR family transcriptional regulator